MRPISQMPLSVAKNITSVFADIDDTLTTDGRLPSQAYGALERLFNAGFNVAPITGRPAGWCDMIARFWPVHGVVGENGAFYFSYNEARKTMDRAFFADQHERDKNKQKLDKIARRVLREVPGSAISADQPYRDVDLAIDFCEDVPALSKCDVERIQDICEEEGAIAKISSIHVNCWFGEFDKLTMSRQFSREALGFDLEEQKDHVVFCGDSPNDAPMFGFFPNSCGVANVLDFKDQLKSKPTWVTEQRGGEGFVELAEILLKAKNY